jgi:hypothetical protein
MRRIGQFFLFFFKFGSSYASLSEIVPQIPGPAITNSDACCRGCGCMRTGKLR